MVKNCEAYHDRYIELLKDWNQFVPEYNAAILQRNTTLPCGEGEAAQGPPLLRPRGHCN